MLFCILKSRPCPCWYLTHLQGFNKNWSSQQVWIEWPTVYQQGTNSPLFLGGGGGGGLGMFFPRKFWNFKALKCDFQRSGDLRPKECAFHSRKCSFQFIDHSQFLQAMNRWWKLNYVLLHVNNFCIKKRLKNDWNIAFIWLKHYGKPGNLYENTSWFLFIQILWYIFFIQTSCFFFVEKSSWRILSAVGAHWNPCIFMSFHSISSCLCCCFKAILLVRF